MTLWCKRDWAHRRPNLCFNPCSIGMTLWWAPFAPRGEKPLWFQSLFYWNDLMVPSSKSFNSSRYILVSILVLLEWPYGESISATRKGGVTPFQSLFYWNDLMVISERIFKRCHFLRFQSLFYWNDLMVSGDLISSPLRSRFQSLFYWNDLMVRAARS